MVCYVRALALIVVQLLLISAGVFGQSNTVNGWLVSSHEQRLNNRWSLLSDVQIRSANHYRYIATVLLRPAVKYSLSDKYSTALGYAYVGNWGREKDKNNFELEHRMWEQFAVESKLKRGELINRARLEQRFIQQNNKPQFLQRLRYYLRLQIPLVEANDFKRGFFIGLQNEIFLNIQNKKSVNNRLFDQNRAFAGLGYRFSETLDLEGGYLYRYQLEEEQVHNHILQVTLKSNFE